MKWGKSKSKTLDPVKASVAVDASQERCFAIFTAQFGGWWPPSNSSSGVADVILDMETGGRWYEVGSDGRETDVGSVREASMPDRLLLAWGRGENWTAETDPSHASEVEVRFTQLGPQQTSVELEHRGFDNHGASAEAVHSLVGGPQGWGYCLDQFAKQATA